MTPDAFDAARRALPAVTMVVQWGDANVYKVGGKVFALMATGRRLFPEGHRHRL